MCWKRRSGEPPVLCRKNFRQAVNLEPSSADLHQRSGDRAHHVLKKAVATNTKYPLFTRPIPCRIIYGPRFVFDFSSCRTEGSEIVTAQKMRCRLIHRVGP